MDITLAKREIVVHFADGRRESANKSRIEWLYAGFRVAKVRRNAKGQIVRVWLLAEPDELAHQQRSYGAVVQDLPTTWSHVACMRL